MLVWHDGSEFLQPGSIRKAVEKNTEEAAIPAY